MALARNRPVRRAGLVLESLFDSAVYDNERQRDEAAVTERPRRLLIVIRTEQEELRIVFIRVVAASRCSSRRRASLRGSGRSRHLGAFGRFRSQARERRTRTSGCCDHRGHSDQVGVTARGNVRSRTAARRGSPVGGGLVPHAFDEMGDVTVIARLDHRAGPHRFGSGKPAADAPLCG